MNWMDLLRLSDVRTVGGIVTAVALSAPFMATATVSAQTVSPSSQTLSALVVCEGQSETIPVSLTLPPASVANKVDVFFLFDDTGSFAGFVPTVTTIFGSLVTSLETALPAVSFGFGVGRFEDFGGVQFGSFSRDQPGARPFVLNHPIVTAETAGGAAARNALITAALDRTAPGDGGDRPESALEALRQVATGAGFDGDGNGSALDSGLAGSLATQTAPGASGDVPPFSSNVAPSAGVLGGVGWRTDALRLVILATDNCSVAPFTAGVPLPSAIAGSGGSEPVSAFACASLAPGDSRFGFVSDAKNIFDNGIAGAVAPLGAATVQGTVNALNALGIRVLGMGPGATPTTSAGPSFAPNVWLSAIARLTGGVDHAGMPLVFSTSVSLPALTTQIADAIATTATRPVDVTLTHTALPTGLSLAFVPGRHLNVSPGGTARFDVTFSGEGTAISGMFNLDFVDAAGSAVLGTIPVVADGSRCPAPGPTVDDTLARFKDASVDLRWSAVPGAQAYAVYRRTDAGAVRIATVGSSTMAFSDRALANGTTYYYSVRWLTADGTESTAGTEISATPTPLMARGQMPPTILSAPVTRGAVATAYRYQVRTGDPDAGEVLTYSLTERPAGMTIDPLNGLIEWTPAPAQFGDTWVTVRVTDRTHRFAQQRYRLRMSGGAPPVITSTPGSSARVGEPYQYQVTASDADGDPVTFSLPAAPAGMTLTTATGLIDWTPGAGQTGLFPVTVVASDPAGLTATQSFTIEVLRTNNPPRITSTPPTAVDLDQDPDHSEPVDLRTWRVIRYEMPSQGPAEWTISPDGTSVVQQQNADASILLSDFSAAGTEVTGTFRVSGTDDDLIGFVFGYRDEGHYYLFDWKGAAQGDPCGTADVGMSVKVVAADTPLTCQDLWPSVTNSPRVRTLFRNRIAWSRDRDYGFTLRYRSGEFTITVTDAGHPIETVTLFDSTYADGLFGFYNYSQGPVLYRAFRRAVLPPRSYGYDVSAVDPDGDAVAFSLESGPDGMTIDAVSGEVRWPVGIGHVGVHHVAVRAIDPAGLFDRQTFDITVAAVNRPPRFTSQPPLSGFAGTRYEYTATATDPDAGDIVQFALGTAPPGMTVDATTGRLLWTPSPIQLGSWDVIVVARDLLGAVAQQSFTVTVTPRPQPPNITSSPLTSVTVGKLYAYQVQAADPQGRPLTYALTQAPSGMVIDETTGLVQWIPASAGTYQVALVVTNDALLTATQGFSVIVQPNRAPAITSSAPSIATVGQTYRYQLVAVDPDNDPVAFSFVSAPVGMSIDSGSGLIQWTPTPADVGDWPVTVRVRDPGNLVGTQTFQIHVQRAYPEPAISIDSPVSGSPISGVVDVVGSIADPSPGNPAIEWTVDLVRGDGKTSSRIGGGSGAVAGATIARIDPTLVRDDSYFVVVTVSRLGQVDRQSFRYEVSSGNLKLGNFTTTFTDIAIPVAGIPLVISRVYDTLDLGAYEFGAGWRLGLPGHVTDSARETPLEPFNQLTRVYVTRPDGRRVGFTFSPTRPSPLLPIFVPGFTPDPGVTDTLTVDAANLANTPSGFAHFLLGTPYNPSLYTLTTKEGVRYLIDEGAGLLEIVDRNGNTLQVTPGGLVSSTGLSLPFERDGAGRITKITEPGGGFVQYAYDGAGNLVSSFDQMGNETKYVYENTAFPHYLTKVEDPLLRPRLRILYDDRGQVVAECKALSNVETFEGCIRLSADANARSQTVIDPQGNRADYVFDARGNPLVERQWLSSTTYLETIRTYDANGFLSTSRDGDGNIVIETHDQRGNLLSRTDAGNHVRRFTYNDCDRIATETDPAGYVTRYEYDANCNPIAVVDAMNGRTQYRYNSRGQKSQYIDAAGNSWMWTYAASGYPATMLDPRGSLIVYDFNTDGDLLRRIDRNGTATTYGYDSTHRLVTETSADGYTATYSFSASGRLATASDSYSQLLFAFDANDRVVRAESLSPFAPHTVVEYRYDASDRVVRVVDSHGGETSYAYDAAGRLVAVAQGGSGVQGKRAEWSYDGASLRTALERYDAVVGGRMVSATSFTYQCGGCADRVTRINHSGGNGHTVQDIALARDDQGNVTQLVDVNGTHLYEYDALGWLRAAHHPDSAVQPEETYEYDAVGNRVSSHLTGVSTIGYMRDSGNRLLDNAISSYEYDLEGRLVSETERATGNVTEYQYDSRGRMSRATARRAAGAQSTMFVYDALDRRIAAISDEETLYWAYDRVHPILKFDSDRTLTQRRMYSDQVDGILADDVGQATRWLLVDQVGSVRDVLDASGQATRRYTYDSFGRVLSAAGDDDLLYVGREMDAAGRRIYMRARTYDPYVGRFQQEDPLHPANYNYANNNPLRFVDPLGLQALVERTEPHTLEEQMVLAEARGGSGTRIMQGRINDPRYPEGMWAKMQHRHGDIVIHFWRNLETGLQHGYKFKNAVFPY